MGYQPRMKSHRSVNNIVYTYSKEGYRGHGGQAYYWIEATFWNAEKSRAVPKLLSLRVIFTMLSETETVKVG